MRGEPIKSSRKKKRKEKKLKSTVVMPFFPPGE
jgi:hypothetical protein